MCEEEQKREEPELLQGAYAVKGFQVQRCPARHCKTSTLALQEQAMFMLVRPNVVPNFELVCGGHVDVGQQEIEEKNAQKKHHADDADSDLCSHSTTVRQRASWSRK